MISSSLATAVRPGQDEAEQRKLFEIAATEAARLERLTTDFLAYARPRPARINRSNLADTLNYIGSIAAAHAGNKGVSIKVDADPDLEGDIDAGQIQQALLNLVLNAIDACQSGGSVTLRATPNGQGASRLEGPTTRVPSRPKSPRVCSNRSSRPKPVVLAWGWQSRATSPVPIVATSRCASTSPDRYASRFEIPAQKASLAEVEP